MTNNNAIATTKMNTGAPPLMAKLSLFPVSKPNASYIERTNGRETVRITPSRPEEWVYGKTPRLIFLYVQSMIRMKNNPDVDQDTHTVVFSWQLPGILRQHRNIQPLRMPERDGGHADEPGANLDLHHEHRRESREQRRMHAVHRRQKRPYTVQARTGHHRINPVHRRDVGRAVEAKRPTQHGCHLASGQIARALDVYIWLTYRTYRLDHVAYVSWRQLYDQFEGTGLPMKDFRRRFKQALSNVLEAAPN